MPKAKRDATKPETQKNDRFRLRKEEKANPQVHVFRKKIVCDTERRGFVRPQGRSPLEIVVDASEGFIPLWMKDMTLRWRFRESSLSAFENPAAVRTEVRKLLGEAILAWGDAVPIKFAERSDAWDFEIVMRKNPDCDMNGCVLASAFFPDAGRHQLTIYPTMFEQIREEQVATLVHEIGHVFGLRHFFANISETPWASEIFGVHDNFSIMNYGDESILTDNDKNDLKRLYELAWSGALTHINGTPIRFVRPFHTVGAPPENSFAIREVRTLVGSETTAAYA